VAHLIDPDDLTDAQIEQVEKLSARFVYQSILDFIDEAKYIFANSPDDQTEIAEDVTREALGRYPGFPLPERIFGTMDFKRAGYIYLPDFITRQALLVDSKAEKTRNVARIQTSQTSLPIRQVRAGVAIDLPGGLGQVMTLHERRFLVNTIFLHYHYKDSEQGKQLLHVTTAALPNGRLANTYVPNVNNTIWVAGPNAPTLGEVFRTRLSFSRLRNKAAWRVQHISLTTGETVSAWAD
jgi:hypothetical protein